MYNVHLYNIYIVYTFTYSNQSHSFTYSKPFNFLLELARVKYGSICCNWSFLFFLNIPAINFPVSPTVPRNWVFGFYLAWNFRLLGFFPQPPFCFCWFYTDNIIYCFWGGSSFLVVCGGKNISPNLTNSKEPEPRPLKKCQEPDLEMLGKIIRSRSRLEKKSGAVSLKIYPAPQPCIHTYIFYPITMQPIP